MTNASPTAEEYFLQQHTVCCQLLRTCNFEKNSEDLHQLRVSIKKIKAILCLLNDLQADFKFKTCFAPYKNIFKHLAPIREEFLQIERLKNDTGNRQIKSKRSARVSKLIKGFKNASSAYLKDIEIILPVILKHLRNLKYKTILPYCQKLLKHLKKQWKNIDNDDKLHRYRKQLKQLLYCSKLLTAKERSQLISAEKLKNIDMLQNIIGQWHDNILLLNRISKDDLAVSTPFYRSLQNETKGLEKNAHKKGGKL